MDLFIDGMTMKHTLQSVNGDFRDISTWGCVKLDEFERVVSFDAPCTYKGSLALQFMPRTIKHFRVDFVFMDMEIDVEALPDGLETFIFKSTCKAFGTIDFRGFPTPLKILILARNRLSGSADLTLLPLSLQTLDIRNNKFSGKVSLESLPKKLESLLLGYNVFSGSLCLNSLPQSLSEFDISACAFSGSLKLSDLPPHLVRLLANDNAFTGELIFKKELKLLEDADFSNNLLLGTAVLHNSVWKVTKVYGNSITTLVDETGTEYQF